MKTMKIIEENNDIKEKYQRKISKTKIQLFKNIKQIHIYLVRLKKKKSKNPIHKLPV